MYVAKKSKIYCPRTGGHPNVKPLGGNYKPSVRGYVDKFEYELKKCREIDKEDMFVYKGEEDGVDLSGHPRDEIRNKLSDRVYESTVTVLFISPNMRSKKTQSQQWIPWEISYSLRTISRKGRKTSEPNAVVAVILPDKSGSYKYYGDMRQFKIVRANIDNGYIELVKWSKFSHNIKKYLDNAIARKETNLDKAVRKIS